jgi:hypothetical protein
LQKRSKHIRISLALSNIKAWSKTIQAWREITTKSRILYPAKLSLNFNGEIKTFQDKDQLKEFMSTKPALQNILKEIFCRKEEGKVINTRGKERIKLKRGNGESMKARKV